MCTQIPPQLAGVLQVEVCRMTRSQKHWIVPAIDQCTIITPDRHKRTPDMQNDPAQSIYDPTWSIHDPTQSLRDPTQSMITANKPTKRGGNCRKEEGCDETTSTGSAVQQCRNTKNWIMKKNISCQLDFIPESTSLNGKTHVQLFMRIRFLNICSRKCYK